MLKSLIASTALAGALLAAAHAQEAAPADSEILPLPEGAVEADGPMEGDAPIVVEDPVEGDAPVIADDPLESDAPTFAEDPAGLLEENWSAVEIATVSADELIGAEIRAPDDARIARVGDVLLAPDGTVENVVAEFGGFLGFGREKVLLTTDDIDVFKSPDDAVLVRTSLTPDALATMPEYEG